MAYAPAANLTSSAGLAHLQQVYYTKKTLDILRKKFVFREVCQHDSLPRRSGRTVQFFRYQNLNSSSTQTVEGAPGTSQTYSSRIMTATVSQYSNFINVSDFLQKTAIDDQLNAASDLLGYQAGLSVDTITRAVIDAEQASTNQTMASPSLLLKVADLRTSRSLLQGIDVQPFDEGYFKVIAHPYVTYDLVNDPAAGGLADIFKYTGPKDTALVKYEDRGTVATVAGCKVMESTNVASSSGPGRWRVYVFGKGGIGCVDLEGSAPSEVRDPKKQAFNVNIIRANGPSIPDPEGLIAGAVSYNFIFTTVVLEGPAGIGGSYRYKTMEAASSIAA